MRVHSISQCHQGAPLSAGPELVKHANVLRTGKVLASMESQYRVTSFSHCAHLQFGALYQLFKSVAPGIQT